jgi:hypothetical protein
MAGTSWPALTAGQKAKASEVESRFDWIEGDILPQSSGTKVTRTHDLGSSSYFWRNIFASGQIKGWTNGSPSAPSFASFDSTTGMYFDVSDDICFARDGVLVAKIAASATTIFNGKILAEDTTTAQPAYAFRQGPTVGLGYQPGVTALPVSIYNSATAVLSAYNNGSVEFVKAPAFEAYWNTTTSNILGSGTAYTLTGQWTEVYDRTGDFSGGVFTVPFSGYYKVDAHVLYSLMNSSMSGSFIEVGAFQDRIVTSIGNNTESERSLNIVTNAYFSQGARIFMTANINGGTKTAGITGNNTIRYTWFAIRLMP